MTKYVINFGIPVGQKGATGQTGDQGPEPELEIGTVTTLQAGTPATVEIQQKQN